MFKKMADTISKMDNKTLGVIVALTAIIITGAITLLMDPYWKQVAQNEQDNYRTVYPGQEFGSGMGSIKYVGFERGELIFTEQGPGVFSSTFFFYRYKYLPGVNIKIHTERDEYRFQNITVDNETQALTYFGPLEYRVRQC